ncbi:hypothetical protein RI367_008714 [Sorochytrium milnesiophthora]
MLIRNPEMKGKDGYYYSNTEFCQQLHNADPTTYDNANNNNQSIKSSQPEARKANEVDTPGIGGYLSILNLLHEHNYPKRERDDIKQSPQYIESLVAQ